MLLICLTRLLAGQATVAADIGETAVVVVLVALVDRAGRAAAADVLETIAGIIVVVLGRAVQGMGLAVADLVVSKAFVVGTAGVIGGKQAVFRIVAKRRSSNDLALGIGFGLAQNVAEPVAHVLGVVD